MGSLRKCCDGAALRLPRDAVTDHIPRSVGLAGDAIQMIQGHASINGKALPHRPGSASLTDCLGGVPQVRRKTSIETIPEGRALPIVPAADDGPRDNPPVFHAPARDGFGMGDNRDDRLDSRGPTALGYIPVANLVGKADIIFVSIDARYPWWEVWEWPSAIRSNRICDVIH